MAYNDLDFIKKFRTPEYEIESNFYQRWSPRAMSGEAITETELMSLFEAAKWAPSAFNNQPWRFLYAARDSQYWPLFFNLIFEPNQIWTKNAAVLLVILSRNNAEYKESPNPTHSFDTGAAWLNLAMEASRRGLITHGMAGFDYEKAKLDLNIPEGFTVEAMVAIGRPGKKEDLAPELQAREFPSDRKKVKEIINEGPYNK